MQSRIKRFLNWLFKHESTPLEPPYSELNESPGVPASEATETEVEPPIEKVAAEEGPLSEAERRQEHTRRWTARLQEAILMHKVLSFPPVNLGYGRSIKTQFTLLKAISFDPVSKDLPKGFWTQQHLVLHLSDMSAPCEGHQQIHYDIRVGVQRPDTIEGHVDPFVYDGDPKYTPRLPREYHYRFVDDAVMIGTLLNQQLEDMQWRITHISLVREMTDKTEDKLRRDRTISIRANTQTQYCVAIPDAAKVMKDPPPSVMKDPARA